MTIKVYISSDKRTEGKTVLAWGIVRYLRSLGHEVEVRSQEKDFIENYNLFPNVFTSRDIVVSTQNACCICHKSTCDYYSHAYPRNCASLSSET